MPKMMPAKGAFSMLLRCPQQIPQVAIPGFMMWFHTPQQEHCRSPDLYSRTLAPGRCAAQQAKHQEGDLPQAHAQKRPARGSILGALKSPVLQ